MLEIAAIQTDEHLLIVLFAQGEDFVCRPRGPSASKASSSTNIFSIAAQSSSSGDVTAIEHAHDDEHAARTGRALFHHLIRIDEKVLAHRRHFQRGERRGGLRLNDRAIR